jgi:FAD/FMN-containing dehydrogenase
MSDTKLWSDLGEALLAGRVEKAKSIRQEYAMPGGPLPKGIVYVTDADMLASTVKWARANPVPLIPASSGTPHYHACLNMPDGAFVVDFSKMRRVINVNRRNRVMLFEAGVTFEELVPLARNDGMRVMLPLMPRAGKSALAAYLDREPVIYPKYQWDISDPLICLEAVYGTGDIFRTGSAAGPGTIQEQWAAGEYQKNPMGPGQNDWMKIIQGAQGGIALATWCSAKCEVRPKKESLFIAGADRLDPLIEASRIMLYKKLTDIHFLVDAPALANLAARNHEDRDKAMALVNKWNVVYSVSGIRHFADERMDYFAKESEKAVKDQGAGLVGPPLMSEKDFLKRLTQPNVTPVEDKSRTGAEMPSDPNWKDLPRGGHGRVFFQTTMDRVAGFVTRFGELAKDAGLEADRISRYIQPQLGGRCCHVEFTVAADGHDQKDLDTVRAFCTSVSEPLIAAGAFFSRPHGAWAGPAMKKATSTFHVFKQVKDIFDPDHILAPGRLSLGGIDHA